LYLFIGRVIKQIVVITEAYYFCNYVNNFIKHAALKVKSICRRKYSGFEATGPLLIIYSAFVKYLKKKMGMK